MHKTTGNATITPNARKASAPARPAPTVTQLNEEKGFQGMAAIELRNVTKTFPTNGGGTYTAIEDLSLTVEEGQFCAVVGPTGCGKSTTLTLVSGLERPTRGEALVHGQPVRGIDTGTGF